MQLYRSSRGAAITWRQSADVFVTASLKPRRNYFIRTRGYGHARIGENYSSGVESSFIGNVQLEDDNIGGSFTGGVESNFIGSIQLDDDAITGTFTGGIASSFVGNVQLDDDAISGFFTSGQASNFVGSIELDNDLITGSFTSGESSNFIGNIQLDNDAVSGNFYTVFGPSEFEGDIQLDDDLISGNFVSFGLPNPLADIRIYRMLPDAPNIAPNIPTYYKDPHEFLDYGFDATDVLAQIPDDNVAGFDIRGNVGLEVLSVGLSDTNLYGVLVGAGYNQATAMITCRLTMASGRVIESSIFIKIGRK